MIVLAVIVYIFTKPNDNTPPKATDTSSTVESDEPFDITTTAYSGDETDKPSDSTTTDGSDETDEPSDTTTSTDGTTETDEPSDTTTGGGEDIHIHDMGEWYTATPASCTAGGSERRDCQGNDCEYYETRNTNSLGGHIMGEWYVATPASCSNEGSERRDCERNECDHYETRSTDKLQHTYTKQTVNNSTKRSDADCTHKATYWYSCKDCGAISNSSYFEYGSFGSHNYVGGYCTVCGDPEPGVPEDTYTRDGEYIYFGSWPQSEVTDSGLISTLDTKAGTLPTSSNSQSWTSYEYYISSSNTTDFMWYIDIDLDNDSVKDYRGVYFTSYRPYYTNNSSSYTNQDDNGYTTGNVYWFKWEPLKWRILTEEGGKALLLCEMLIDSQAYQNCYKYTNDECYATDDNGNILTDNGSDVYANNYEYSTIRAWLADTFYEQAFTEMQKSIIQLTTVDNSASSTTDSGNNLTQSTKYACGNTQDYVFLLSGKEVTNSEYDFASYSTRDTARQKKPTAYAQCQGAYAFDGNEWWWLRSPYNYYSYIARDVRDYGIVGYSYVDSTNHGVCPALWISL